MLFGVYLFVLWLLHVRSQDVGMGWMRLTNDGAFSAHNLWLHSDANVTMGESAIFKCQLVEQEAISEAHVKGKMSKNNTRYCVNCDAETEYVVDSKMVDMSVRGDEIDYVELIARCAVCGEEVYVPEINDLNMLSRAAAYERGAVNE